MYCWSSVFWLRLYLDNCYFRPMHSRLVSYSFTSDEGFDILELGGHFNLYDIWLENADNRRDKSSFDFIYAVPASVPAHPSASLPQLQPTVLIFISAHWMCTQSSALLLDIFPATVFHRFFFFFQKTFGMRRGLSAWKATQRFITRLLGSFPWVCFHGALQSIGPHSFQFIHLAKDFVFN